MTLSNVQRVLNPRRIGRLFLRDLAHGYRGLLIAAATVSGGIIVFSALRALMMSAGGAPVGTVQGDGYFTYFQNLLFLGGCIVTSLAFREVWHGGSGIAYLTLPGSTLEKLIVKLLLTSVGFVVGAMAFMSAVAAVSEALDRLVFGVGHGFFNPFTPAALQAAARYLVLQSFFLLGSIWFRKLAFVKTVLTLMVIGIALMICVLVALRIGVASRIAAAAQDGGARMGWAFQLNGTGLPDLFQPGARGYQGAMAFKTVAEALAIALAPASWLAAYFRLSEAEV